jgi:hypothetical protein
VVEGRGKKAIGLILQRKKVRNGERARREEEIKKGRRKHGE